MSRRGQVSLQMPLHVCCKDVTLTQPQHALQDSKQGGEQKLVQETTVTQGTDERLVSNGAM